MLLGSHPPSWGGRLGYRLAWRDLIVGLGPAFGTHGLSLSPELGIKLAHSEEAHQRNEVDPCLHVLARADLARDGFRGATLLLGWSFL